MHDLNLTSVLGLLNFKCTGCYWRDTLPLTKLFLHPKCWENNVLLVFGNLLTAQFEFWIFSEWISG